MTEEISQSQGKTKEKTIKYTDNNDIQLINGDCLVEMEKIEKNSINCILTDSPYGVSLNKWDTIIDLDKMWKLFKKILKKVQS